MTKHRIAALAITFALGTLGLSCSSGDTGTTDAASETSSETTAAPAATDAPTVDLPDVVVTYSVLAAFVSGLVAGVADVVTIIPDGQDPHTFEPSAKDIASLNDAAFVVANGLGLEAGIDNALTNAAESGTDVFFVADHRSEEHTSELQSH